jgi:sporulation protein YlmC with PRC-barrel domain
MTFRTGTAIATLAIALGFTPAVAQTTTQQRPATTEVSKAPVAGQIVAQDAGTILAKDFIGTTVYALDNSKIGTISDLVLNKDGKTVDGFVIGVGGFLGIGEKSVALKIDRLKMSTSPNGGVLLTMDTTKDELSSAPSFKSKRDMDAEKAAAERPSATQPTRPSGN